MNKEYQYTFKISDVVVCLHLQHEILVEDRFKLFISEKNQIIPFIFKKWKYWMIQIGRFFMKESVMRFILITILDLKENSGIRKEINIYTALEHMTGKTG